MKILLVLPPMAQVNSYYPATAYLKGYLQERGHDVVQMDLGLELFLKIFSRQGLSEIKDVLEKKKNKSDSVLFFLEAFSDYLKCIEPVIQFLQGKNPSLALRLAERKLVPEGPRFLPLREHAEILFEQFGTLGVQDKAKYIASLYLDDLSDVIKTGIDSDFEFSRYAEKLASSQNSFSPLYKKLNSAATLLDQWTENLFVQRVKEISPEIVGFSIPFPGNLYAALRMGKCIKEKYKKTPVVLGGGFVNTELRELTDSRIFEFTDYLVYDDGEFPFQKLLEFFEGKASEKNLCRCKGLRSKKVVDFNFESKENLPFKKHPGPDFKGLHFDKYVSMLELPNPVHRLWSDFRWNKMVLAHGCYWKRCAFCDINLDYIARFEPLSAKKIVDQIEKIICETSTTGFHFVDEAVPPALMKAMSEEILRRNLVISWWGNLRFDQQFDKELCELMVEAGCVAVTGGLEVASPRLLKLINKGVTLDQVAQVTKNFSQAGILVHAYLMYGFPTQTVQETIDSLEVVRQLFEAGCLQSAHWHRFLLTSHSPVSQRPSHYSVKLKKEKSPANGLFARYEIGFEEESGVDHDQLGVGLRKALYNFMHQVGLEQDLRSWFDQKVPKTSLSKNYIQLFL